MINIVVDDDGHGVQNSLFLWSERTRHQAPIATSINGAVLIVVLLTMYLCEAVNMLDWPSTKNSNHSLPLNYTITVEGIVQEK